MSVAGGDSGMQIRQATTNDIMAIQSVARASWDSDYRFLTRDSLSRGIHEWYSTERIRGAITNPSTLLLVAQADGYVVGFAHSWADFQQREGTLLRMYVHPEYRRRGIGQALYEETAAMLAAEGIDTLRATSLADNPLGNDLYRSLGFENVDQQWTNIGGNWVLENTYYREDIGRAVPEGRRVATT
jgi:ribosomal protein S18 acetylase RimI-like enzyme